MSQKIKSASKKEPVVSATSPITSLKRNAKDLNEKDTVKKEQKFN